jgi:hypothetical protein
MTLTDSDSTNPVTSLLWLEPWIRHISWFLPNDRTMWDLRRKFRKCKMLFRQQIQLNGRNSSRIHKERTTSEPVIVGHLTTESATSGVVKTGECKNSNHWWKLNFPLIYSRTGICESLLLGSKVWLSEHLRIDNPYRQCMPVLHENRIGYW